MIQKTTLNAACEAFLTILDDAKPETAGALVEPAQALIGAIPATAAPQELLDAGLQQRGSRCVVQEGEVSNPRNGIAWLLFLGSEAGGIAAANLAACNGLVDPAERLALFTARRDAIRGAVERVLELCREPEKFSDNDARDQFIYRSREQGKTNAWILREIQKRSAAKGWEPLETEQAISQAAKRFAERKGKPWPIPRQPN